MESQLRELLDRIYELEGLVHLSLRREDSREDFCRLISLKGKEVEGICQSLSGLFAPGKNQIQEENIKEEKLSEDEETPEEKEDAYSEKEETIDSEEREEEADAEEFEIEQMADGEPFSFDEYNLDDSEDNNLFEYEKAELKPEDNDSEYQIEDEEEIVPSNRDSRGKLVFSINDRFRFRKELFDNSDIGFNNSLALVASMDAYEEAEDYFINDLGMNPANPVVNEFLDIIRKYFR